MPDDQLIPASPPSGTTSLGPPETQGGGALSAYDPDAYLRALEPEEGGIDVRRYLMALLRYKWLLIVALVLGCGGAAFAWSLADLRYTADGTLWVEVIRTQNAGDVAPVRQSGLARR